jgi:uncharacterized OsmC-like protein
MSDPAKIKVAIERNQKALTLRPSIGRGTATTVVRVRDGTTCDIEDGKWMLVADESTGDGGGGLGPDPGVFGRAALGSCLAIGYMMWAAVRGVPIDSCEVEVESDYDASGPYALDDDAPAGWSAMRYTVKISSPAPESEIQELVEWADRHSSLLWSFSRPIPITRELQVTATAER